MNNIISTERLNLREFTLNDAEFVVELLNTEGWLRYIGDRNVKTAEDAKAYLSNGILKGYKESGFGFYLVELKEDKTPIGMCGLIKRATLKNPDIGFAFLPEFTKFGYAFEAATATMDLARNRFKMETVWGITLPENGYSIRLLEKIGMHSIDTFIEPDTSEELIIFSTVN